MKCFLAQEVHIYATNILTGPSEWFNPYLHACSDTVQRQVHWVETFRGLLCLGFGHPTLSIINMLSESKFPFIPEQPHLNSPEQTPTSKIKIPREMENAKARTHSHFRYFQGRNTNSEFPICRSNGSLRQIEMRPRLPISLHSEQNAPCFPNWTLSTKSISE